MKKAIRKKKKIKNKEDLDLIKSPKKSLKTKKKYVPVKPLFGDGEDYYIYHLSLYEKILGSLIGFFAGAFVAMVFFRNVIISLILGLICVIPARKMWEEYLRDKRIHNLLLQFRDMMEALSSSYSAGKNTLESFGDAYADLEGLYGAKADIVHEAYLITSGLYNGQNIDALLDNFAKRSHLDDIESFATIFEVSNHYGGNLKKVVGETREIINDKIETEMEIQTMLTANKNELNIMIIMPIIIMVMLSGMGDLSIVQNTPMNILVKCIALVIFAAAYIMGRKIVDIKI